MDEKTITEAIETLAEVELRLRKYPRAALPKALQDRVMDAVVAVAKAKPT